jgi:hypothetical protein
MHQVGGSGGEKDIFPEWAAERFQSLNFFLTGYKNLIYQIP